MLQLLAQLSWVAVVIAAILSLVIGFLWMSVFFKSPYRKYMYNIEDVQNHPSPSGGQMAFSFLTYIFVSLITAVAYAVSLNLFRAVVKESVMTGMIGSMQLGSHSFVRLGIRSRSRSVKKCGNSKAGSLWRLIPLMNWSDLLCFCSFSGIGTNNDNENKKIGSRFFSEPVSDFSFLLGLCYFGDFDFLD